LRFVTTHSENIRGVYETITAKKIAGIIATGAILIPIPILFYDLSIGTVAFFIGLFIAHRAHSSTRYLEDPDSVNESDCIKLRQHHINSSNIILVQVVDDQGHDLPPHIADQKMKEARRPQGFRHACA
jgi:hypothetical protein